MKTSNKKDIIITAIIVALVVYIATRELTLFQISKNLPTQNQSESEASLQSPLKKNTKGNEADPYEKEQVKNTLTKAGKEFQECYLDYLKTKPVNQSVQIKADWQIENDGRTKSADVISSENEVLGKCLVSKINNLTFPPPPEGRPYYVAHTFNFKTVEQLAREQKEREEMEKKLSPKEK